MRSTCASWTSDHSMTSPHSPNSLLTGNFFEFNREFPAGSRAAGALARDRKEIRNKLLIILNSVCWKQQQQQNRTAREKSGSERRASKTCTKYVHYLFSV